MLQTDSSNTIFKLAADFVNNTSRHIFLTGKAGTGKTTFLKYIKENSHKNVVVVAPTGVAAINAGGVTMHSFFQLPFGPYIPGTKTGFSNKNDEITDKHSLFTNIRFNGDKRILLEELELLVIDEISMVRADMLDAMDAILRYFRKKPQYPFGGVQVLYIGDMFQLPPVVPNNEWDILNPYYESPFFFDAKVICEAPPLYIELKKIYRQSEHVFIDLLNRVRNNCLIQEDFTLLNSRYKPNFSPSPSEKFITLSSHNRKADAINVEELAKLKTRLHLFSAAITGEFSDKALPTERELQLKEGAQVMFIKNDSGTERRYYNGKLATIKSIRDNEIMVITNDENEELKLEKETWRNVRYSFVKESDSIKEEELGSFTQYPIRLAWAITIHKSQGLTFEKAIIDAGASFAAGQVYVALSRCTSLAGVVLLSKINSGAIATDPRILAFAQKEAATDELAILLKSEQAGYLSKALIKSFDWKKLIAAVQDFAALLPGKKLPDGSAKDLCNQLFESLSRQAIVAEKFQNQLEQILNPVNGSADPIIIQDRCSKAISYFVNAIGNEILIPLEEHIASLGKTTRYKKYTSSVTSITDIIRGQIHKMLHVKWEERLLCNDPGVFKQFEKKEISKSPNPSNPKKPKQIKGSSQRESLNLFKSGKSPGEIALLRQLAESTINSHLAGFIRAGQLDIMEVLQRGKFERILKIVQTNADISISDIKEQLNDDCSFSDIRMVLSHCQWITETRVNA
jgi:hypothetical protein